MSATSNGEPAHPEQWSAGYEAGFKDGEKAGAALRADAERYARGDAAPVAWIQPDHLQKARVYPFLCRVEPTQRMADFVPVFTRPSRPLTDEQIESIRRQCVGVCSGEVYSSMFARAIERAHGITAQVK